MTRSAPHRHARGSLVRIFVGLCLFLSQTAFAADTPEADVGSQPECAPGLIRLPHDICAFEPAPKRNAPKVTTLIIFLHGLMPGDLPTRHGWESHAQQLALRAGVALLIPHGLLGVGPGRTPDILAWPTSEKMRALHEGKLLEGWRSAQADFERRRGITFERTYVFGFSNGAYYATSLAARARLKVQGYAVFGGGSGAAYVNKSALKASLRPPIFIGIGKRDSSRADARSLGVMLTRLRWKHQLVETAGGHNVTTGQVKDALRFLAAHPLG